MFESWSSDLVSLGPRIDGRQLTACYKARKDKLGPVLHTLGGKISATVISASFVVFLEDMSA